MTLIAVVEGLVIADSARMTSAGMQYSSGKIFPYPKASKMWSRRLKFVDHFFGFAGTGEDEAIQAAGDIVLCGALDLVTDRYRAMDDLRLINDWNQFSLLLFGLQGVAVLHMQSGKVELEYERYDVLSSVSVGSGHAAFKRLYSTDYKTKICPVRAFYGTFALEPTCGGEIEVWRMPLHRRDKLTKLAQMRQRTLPEIFQFMATPTKYHFKEVSTTWRSTITQLSAKRSSARSPRKAPTKTSRPQQKLQGSAESSSTS
ncbi:hypothetical protein LUCX_219 [Xanthomonas phage vB_XciM_LucasX]|nr:hypothetical protein LUCX_219 [Xanthomonas phage vB_XciM_LucasX]